MNIREIFTNIYNKFFNKEEKQKLLNEKIEKEVEVRYNRAINSDKKYTCSDEKLKDIIRKKVEKNEKKKSFKKKLRTGVVIGASATVLAAGGAIKHLDNQNKDIPQVPSIETLAPTSMPTNKTSIIHDTESEDAKLDITDIVDMYNEKYPDANIKKSDLGIIKQEGVNYLVKETTPSGKIKYIENAWSKDKLKENQEYIGKETFKGGYVLLANGKVIASVAKIEGKNANIQVKKVAIGKKEYESNDEGYYEFEDPNSVVEPLEKFYQERSKEFER